MPLVMCMRDVTMAVLCWFLSLCIYFLLVFFSFACFACFFLVCLFLTACFWRNKDAYKVYLLIQFLMTKLCQTFIISLWIGNRFQNTFYKFGTLFHCFNDCSLDYHIVRAQNVLLWRLARMHCRREDALSHQSRYQLHSVEGGARNIQLFLNFVNS